MSHTLERGDIEIMKKLRELQNSYPSSPQLTFVSLFEYMVGLKLRNNKSLSDNLSLLKKFNVLNTTDKSADILSDLKIKYDKKGLSLPLADLLSASIVIENNLTLLTRDTDFKNIEELKKIII